MARNVRSKALAEPSATGGEQEHPLAEAGRETTQTASHLAERATDTGIRRVDQGREQAAEGLSRLAQHIRRASSEIESDQPPMANLAGAAAEQTERVASFLRETDTRQMVGTLEDYARRQPLLFLGGAFALGLVATRFMKAGAGSTGAGRPSGGRGTYVMDGTTGAAARLGSTGTSGTRQPTGPGVTGRTAGSLTDAEA